MLSFISRRDFLKTVSAAVYACTSKQLIAAGKPENDKLNILFILVDDLGKEWISCYGAEDIETPNIDALAAGGMKFNNAYSMSQCTPSRVSLLTGQYPWKNGWVNHWDVPRWGVGYFDWKQKRNVTFSRLMKDLGYVTCVAGKWQINDFRLEPQAMRKHGFDEWCMWTGSEAGNPASNNRYQNPYINTRAGSKTYKGQFGPDVYTDFLIDFMKKHKEKPMCLYYPMTLPHNPLSPTPDEPSVVTKIDKHKAMVRYIDRLVGRLVLALEDLNLRKKTIIVFTTDNGTSNRIVGTRKGMRIRGAKMNKTESGVCQPYIVNCPELVPSGIETDALTDFTDILPTFIEIGGGKVSSDLTIDGTSIAPVIFGKEKDSARNWILGMGHGAAILDSKGIRGAKNFASRVIRNKQFKAWVSDRKKIVGLFDLKADPFEKNNLLRSNNFAHQIQIKKFQRIVDSFPDKDARPAYALRKENPWDRKLKK